MARAVDRLLCWVFGHAPWPAPQSQPGQITEYCRRCHRYRVVTESEIGPWRQEGEV